MLTYTFAIGSMSLSPSKIRQIVAASHSRTHLWIAILRQLDASTMAEIGVFRGDFAACVLKECPFLRTYYMIDPWRHLDNWNKPWNADDALNEQHFLEARGKTAFATEKRIILRGTTTEVIDTIPDDSLDLAYIDGDHTLRGITVDLHRAWRKVHIGGVVGGDDFARSIWHHGGAFEPTMVFPYAVYFAEAVGAPIYALPHSQFLIQRPPEPSFRFVDLTGAYGDTSLLGQLACSPVPKGRLLTLISQLGGLLRRRRAARNSGGSSLRGSVR